jgi:prepilin-type N-terminal cleavage/methylation domain-containing protein
MPRPNRPRTRRAFTLLELLVVIGMVACLVCMLIPAVVKVREAAARSQCQNNLRQLGISAHDYNDSLGRLPPTVGWTFPDDPGTGGNAFGSVFFHLVPYLE